MSKRAIILAAAALTLLPVGLSACGQKGPLYLPAASPAATAAAGPASAPAASSPSASRPQ
ncbi:LPS translocon maturation chaperone LptM [Caldimonas manganoxidans]|uniref:LPS translocon maturation chaperone LptM n=1 Tax=Caldimonas manganoxidans TaxID=196015 RepID=UPI001FDF753D|nr:lipoprotein [Caldimonas manganoxidans]